MIMSDEYFAPECPKVGQVVRYKLYDQGFQAETTVLWRSGCSSRNISNEGFCKGLVRIRVQGFNADLIEFRSYRKDPSSPIIWCSSDTGNLIEVSIVE